MANPLRLEYETMAARREAEYAKQVQDMMAEGEQLEMLLSHPGWHILAKHLDSQIDEGLRILGATDTGDKALRAAAMLGVLRSIRAYPQDFVTRALNARAMQRSDKK